MATTTNYYCVDLGFDWYAHAIGKRDGHDIYPLQYGILSKGTTYDDQTSTPSTTFSFADISANVSDCIFFVVYDITSLCPGNKSLPTSDVALEFTMTFTQIDQATAAQPLSPTTYHWTSSNMTVLSTNAGSTVFNIVGPPDGIGVPMYAVGPVNGSSGGGFGANGQVYTFQDITTDLTTNLRISLAVTYTLNGSATTKYFGLDPEMIIGASNNGNPDPDGGETPPKPGR